MMIEASRKKSCRRNAISHTKKAKDADARNGYALGGELLVPRVARSGLGARGHGYLRVRRRGGRGKYGWREG
jgi:hypothetical protein